MHDFFNALILIALIFAVVWLRSNRSRGSLPDLRWRARGGLRDDREMSDTREGELEAEIVELRKRIAVLERIATDERKSRDIAAEIEALRDGPPAANRQSTNG
jgi:hypothetical protein